MSFSLPHSDHNYQFGQHCHKLLLHCFVILFEARILSKVFCSGRELWGGGGDVRESDEEDRADLQDHEDPQVNSRIIMLKVRIVVVMMVMIIVTLMLIIMKITKSKKDLQTGTPHHRIADPRTNIEMQVELTSSAQRVGFFNIGSGQVGYWTKYRVAGRVRVG